MRSRCMFSNSASWLLVLCMGLVAAACRNDRAAQPANLASQPAASSPVHFIAATMKPVEDQLTLSAKVQADPARLFRVFPPASGKVLAIRVKPGDIVTRGETLATIQSADAGAAQSDLMKAEIESARAQRAADREKVLLNHGAVAEKDYIDAKAAADTAQAEVERAKQHIQLLGVVAHSASDSIPLSSPSRGVVLTVSSAAGEFSKSLDSSDPLMTIADLSTVWIVGDVFEKDIAKLQPGIKVTVTVEAFPGQQWTGRVNGLSGALDPVTRTLKVRVALPNPGSKLKPEMFAALHVAVGKHSAIVVPNSVVVHEGQNTVAFVENNGKPEQRNVTVGQALDGAVEITSGIEAGERVAANGADLLTGGASQQ